MRRRTKKKHTQGAILAIKRSNKRNLRTKTRNGSGRTIRVQESRMLVGCEMLSDKSNPS